MQCYLIYCFNDVAKALRIYPLSQAVYIGGKAVITCGSESLPTWEKSGKVVNRGKVHKNQLIIYNVQELDAGMYGCYGTYTNGTVFYVQSELLVGGKDKKYFKQ